MILTGSPIPRQILAAALGPRHRTSRMVGLLSGILILSFADLYMTMIHLKGLGMAEANPLARIVIEYGSGRALVAWKLATVLLTVLIFFRARHKRAAELGALFCCAVLCWLTLRWADYNDQVSSLTHELNVVADADHPTWVSLNPER